MGYRILYFYKKKNAFYLEKKRGGLLLGEKELGGQGEDMSVKAFFCGVPEYYGKRRRWPRWKRNDRVASIPWHLGQLLCLMQNYCEYVSADAYYLEECFEKELAESGFGFVSGRQRMCGGMIKNCSGQFLGIDSILYLAGKRQEGYLEMPLQKNLLRKMRYFFYLGEKTKQYAILEENLWQEYGMPLMTVKDKKELTACQIKRLLILDDRPEGEADWETLPKGCVYLDFWSVSERRKEILENRADIKYISEYLYLLQNLDIS